MAGRSLLPQARGEEKGPEFIVTEVRRGPSDPGYRSVRTKSWKLIESLAGERQLYNLDDDPVEKIDLADAQLARVEEMSRVLHEWIEQHLEDGEEDPMRIWPL
jgi:arylsulfatase A-like enzyme